MADEQVVHASTAFILAYAPDSAGPDVTSLVDGVQATMVDVSARQFTTVDLSGGTAAVTPRIIPVLPIDGVKLPLDPRKPDEVLQVVDYLFRTIGHGGRRYLDEILDVRLAELSASGQPATVARSGELAEMQPLRDAIGLAWQKLYGQVGVLLDNVDAAARRQLGKEIAKARERAAYETVGLTRDAKDQTITVGDQSRFDSFVEAVKQLAASRDEIRRLESGDATPTTFSAFGAHLTSARSGGIGAALQADIKGLLADTQLARTPTAYAKLLADLAEVFPLLWHLGGDLSAESDADQIRDWAGRQLAATNSALDELNAGAVSRAPSAFYKAYDPVEAAVADAAPGSWSVWQYPSVIGLGVVDTGFTPGSLGWAAAWAVTDLRAHPEPPDTAPGWIFDAFLLAAPFVIPGIGTLIVLLGVMSALWRAYSHINAAEQGHEAYLASLDPMGALNAPDTSLALAIIMAIPDVALNLFFARNVLGPMLNNVFKAGRRLVVTTALIEELTVGSGWIPPSSVPANVPAIYRLVHQADQAAANELTAFVTEAEQEAARVAAAQAAAAEAAATRAAESAAAQAATPGSSAQPAAAADPQITWTTSGGSAASQVVYNVRQLPQRSTSMSQPGAPGSTSLSQPGAAGTTSASQPGGPGSTSGAEPSGESRTSQTRPSTPQGQRGLDRTSAPVVPSGAPSIEEILNSRVLLGQATQDVIQIAKAVAPKLGSILEDDPSLAEKVTVYVLTERSEPFYASAETFAGQLAKGRTFAGLRPFDVSGFVSSIAGGVNEILVIKEGSLLTRLQEEAMIRWRLDTSGQWSYPKLVTQVRIDTGGGMKLAHDTMYISYTTGVMPGRVRIWSWGQITIGNPEHLLDQNFSDVFRLAAPGALLEVEGRSFNVASQVVWARPTAIGDLTATKVLGAVNRPLTPAVATGLTWRGVDPVQDIFNFGDVQSFPMGWTSADVRTLVRAILTKYGRIGH